MFQAVRQWWGNGTGKVTARLFAFEFIVVVTGVLVAQVLAGWAQNRAAITAMEEARDRAESEIRDNMYVARVYLRAVPCFENRMREVMREASQGPIDRQLAVRPSLKSSSLSPISDQSALLLRKEDSGRWSDIFDSLIRNVAGLEDRSSKVADEWGKLTLAETSNGDVSPGDRLAAREAAANILAQLRGMRINSENILQRGSQLGLQPQLA